MRIEGNTSINQLYHNNDELCHYGVVGMKWGVRRARNQGKQYTYTSYGTKRYKRIAEKARITGNTARQKKYEGYHKKSVDLDRKMQNNALKNSAGRALLKTVVNGPFGGRTYEAVKVTSGNSKYASRVAAHLASVVSGPFGATAARALYVRGVDANSIAKDVKKIID